MQRRRGGKQKQRRVVRQAAENDTPAGIPGRCHIAPAQPGPGRAPPQASPRLARAVPHNQNVHRRAQALLTRGDSGAHGCRPFFPSLLLQDDSGLLRATRGKHLSVRLYSTCEPRASSSSPAKSQTKHKLRTAMMQPSPEACTKRAPRPPPQPAPSERAPRRCSRCRCPGTDW